MASMNDEVITMPNLTLRQWEVIEMAVILHSVDLQAGANREAMPGKKHVMKKMADECLEITAIIGPVVKELSDQAIFG